MDMSYFFANWKMYLTVDDSLALAKQVAQMALPTGLTCAVFPNTLAFTGVAQALSGSAWQLGAQDVFSTPQGAYTGATSALMFKDVGAKYALVGHSEKRYVFGESDDDVRKKVVACVETGLRPVVCVGETEEDRRDDKRQYRLKKQLLKVVSDLSFNSGSVFVAYEPIWAVGTGDPCSPADADDVAGWIKLELKNYTDSAVSVLYGGSVTSENVADYYARESVDGVLVGSASVNAHELAVMLKALS